MSEYRIDGQVVDRADGSGVPGLRVEAWDKDLIVDDLLGAAQTTAGGAFSIVFDESYFEGLLGERSPDLFFRVFAGRRRLLSTEDSVLWNLAAGTTPIRLEVDMNGSPVNGDSEGRPPAEIPWQLAASTQSIGAGAPFDTTVSLFYYEPRLETLAEQYPNHRLVYLRVAASISPYQPDAESFAEPIVDQLVGGLPVVNAIVDLKVLTPEPNDEQPQPFFLSASPTRRTMVETGLVGADLFEGEANGMSIGKSGSQMHETASAHATSETKKSSGGANFLVASASFSNQTTTSSMDSERTVRQDMEINNRNASSERRELSSHMSKVENILSLLTAKHVGSPYLRFSLLPRPLATLSADASDPNLWYSQLLRRRSSGIEGLQEFFAVVAVPNGIAECTVTATLRRIVVLDNPPEPPATGWLDYTWDRYLAMLDHLLHVYPRGVPVEELDVDLQLDPQQFKRPIILSWTPGVPDELGYVQDGRDVVAYIGDFDTTPGMAVALCDYKRVEEVALEMYEEDLARSPLERGVVLAQDLKLTTGFECTEEGGVLPTTHSVQNTPAVECDFSPLVPATPPFLRRHRGPTSVPYQHVHTATNWNLLESQLAKVMTNLAAPPTPRGRAASRRLQRLVLERMAGLQADDPRNASLERAAKGLGLTRAQRADLASAGISDVRGLASALLGAGRAKEVAAQVERLNAARAQAQLAAIKAPVPVLGEGQANALLDHLAGAILKGQPATRGRR